MDKILKPLNLYPAYLVSNDGGVYSLDRFVKSNADKVRFAKGRKIKSFLTNSGYEQVSLTNKHKKFYVHRLVAECFIRKIGVLEEVNHKDGNKLNNHLSNLEIVTESENKKHAYRVLNHKPWNIKLTKTDAIAIRQLYKKHKISQKQLGELYGVSAMVVNRIINNVQMEYK